VSVPNRGEAGASSLGVHGRESPASRSFLSRGSGVGWQRQWCAWSAPALPRELLCSFRHWSGRAQHRSGLPRTRGLTNRRQQSLPGTMGTSSQHVYEVRPRKDHRGVDLISDTLPFRRLWYGEPDAVANAINYAKFFSCSHDAVIHVYDEAGNVIETHEHAGDFKEW